MTPEELDAYNKKPERAGKPPLERLVVKGKVGYLGKGKGVKQVLWERGLWRESMVLKVAPKRVGDTTDEKGREVGGPCCATSVLTNCPDFVSQRGVLRELIESRGHLMLESPVAHPELAGAFFQRAADAVLACLSALTTTATTAPTATTATHALALRARTHARTHTHTHTHFTHIHTRARARARALARLQEMVSSTNGGCPRSSTARRGSTTGAGAKPTSM